MTVGKDPGQKPDKGTLMTLLLVAASLSPSPDQAFLTRKIRHHFPAVLFYISAMDAR